MFREVIEKVIEQKEVDAEELRDYLEKTYEVDWQYQQRNLSENRKRCRSSSLIYQAVEGLIKSIGLPKNSLCTACITGE